MNTHSVALRNLAELSLLSEDTQADLQSLFGNFVPKLGDELRAAWHAIANYTPKERVIANADRFNAVMSTQNYLDIGSFQMACPEGLNTDYLTYTDLLVKAVFYCQETRSVSVKNLKQHLARLLNGNVISYSPSGIERAIIERAKAREALEKQIKECLSHKTNRTIAYTQAIARNSDWTKVFSNVEKIQSLDNDARSALDKDLAAIDELLDAVVEKVQSPENKNVNKQAVKYTAELVYAVGAEVKFIAQVFYLTESLTTRLSEAVDKSIKVFG